MDNIKVPIINQNDEQPEGLPESPKKKESIFNKELLSTLSIIIIAPIIAFLLTIFVFQSYEVDGPSMEKTLFNQDRLIVNKLGKTWARITTSDYIPDRYSIIVFNYTGQSDYEVQKKQLIKRVIGVPGDRVVIKNGLVTIYNSKHPEGFYPDKEGPESSVIQTTSGNLDLTVDQGEVFVMGDNRANSLDSRVFGPVSTKDIVGELSARIYPFDSVKKF